MGVGRKALALVGLLLLAGLLVAGGTQASSRSYVAIDLGTLGGNYSGALAENDAGQVVGFSTLADGSSHAFSWTENGGMVDLGTLGGRNSGALAVSPSGQVIGDSDTANGDSHAFSWTKKIGMVDLGTLGGTYTIANAISAGGRVVGFSNTGYAEHAFSWTKKTGMVDLGTLGGTNSMALAVSPSGQIVGSSYLPGDSVRHPFSWTEKGGMVDLGSLGGISSDAYAVSPTGVVVGTSNVVLGTGNNATEGSRAFLWTAKGGMVDLGTLGGTQSAVGGSAPNGQLITPSGQVIGRSQTTGDPAGLHGFSWTANGGMIDLGTLGGNTTTPLEITNSGQIVGSSNGHAFSWTKQGGIVDLGTLGGAGSGAGAINSSGQIVGTGSTAQGATHAVLWKLSGT